MSEIPRGATQVLERQDAGPRPADPAASTRPDTLSPVNKLFTGVDAPMGNLARHYRGLRRAGFSREVSGIVVRAGIAAARQEESTIHEVSAGLDRQASHPAIRSRFEERGAITAITDEHTPRTAEERTAVRGEVGTRVMLFQLNEHLNSLNGSGPKGAAREALTSAAISEVNYIVEDERAEVDPQLAATVGMSERRPIPDASHDIADDNDGPLPTSKDVYIPPFAEDRRRIRAVAAAKAEEKYSGRASFSASQIEDAF